MDETISKLKTPEECLQYANKCTALAQEARRRAIELRANAQNAKSEVETELWKALYAYEEILTHIAALSLQHADIMSYHF